MTGENAPPFPEWKSIKTIFFLSSLIHTAGDDGVQWRINITAKALGATESRSPFHYFLIKVGAGAFVLVTGTPWRHSSSCTHIASSSALSLKGTGCNEQILTPTDGLLVVLYVRPDIPLPVTGCWNCSKRIHKHPKRTELARNEVFCLYVQQSTTTFVVVRLCKEL